MVQVLRGLGERSFQQSSRQEFKKNLDTMSIIAEIDFFTLNQTWDKKRCTCSNMTCFILEVDFLAFGNIKNNIIVIKKQVISLITILPLRIE